MVLPDSSEPAPADTMNDLPWQKRISWAYLLELALVLCLSCLVFGLQVGCFSAKLSLLFDSQGYIFTTQSCLKALGPENIQGTLQYLLGGCQDEHLRATIVSHMPGISELVKCGPVLPGILMVVYALAGKTLSLAHWQLAASSMVAITALSVCGIWAWARALGGATASRIAILLAITYSGFAANAGRILCEIPATCLSVFALLSVYSYCCFLEKQSKHRDLAPQELKLARKRQQSFELKQQLAAVLPGLLTGLLMLARPTFLPWPLLLSFCLFVYCLSGGKRKIFSLGTILSFLLGCSIALLPWSAVKQVLTGTPSIMVERHGPMNLSRGMDLRTDGFDSLPSSWVSHPETFHETTGQVLSQLGKQFAERPAAFFHLLLRKPARLLDSPWNDFQTKALGMPFLLQRFQHQFILLAALLGVVMLLEHGRKRPDHLLLLAGMLAGMFLAFHLVSCAFITMSRYFITAMPVAIVTASYFLAELFKQGRRSLPAFSALLLAPSVSLLFYYLLMPGYGRLSDLSSDFGLAPLSLAAAFIMTAAVAAAILLPAFTIFRAARSKLLLCFIALTAGFCCFVTVCYQFMCTEAVVRLGSIDHARMISNVNIPPGAACTSWYLVIDANDASVHAPEQAEGILADMELRLNGREIRVDWLPLLAQDESMREEMMYLAAFAYSAQKNCSDFRQWRCTTLPAESIVCPGDNKFEFSLKNKEKNHPKFFADFTDPLGKRIHTVSLREFSWTKGFFAGCPGEMRQDEWPENTERSFEAFTLCGQASKLKPRAFLLGIRASNTPETLTRSIAIPDQRIGPSPDKMMSSFDIAPLAGVSDSASPGQSLRIKVSGQLRCLASPASASVALIEGFRQGSAVFSEYAPLAPQTLLAEKEWRDFAFEDVLNPLRANKSGDDVAVLPASLASLKLEFFETPWWEALAYGVFKGKAGVEFRQLKLEIYGQPALDLAKNNAQWYELNSQFELSP